MYPNILAKGQTFNFSSYADEALRTWHEDAAQMDVTGMGAYEAEMHAAWVEAMVTEAHRRALGIKVRSVITIPVAGGWSSNETFIGTSGEFMEAFGLRLADRPFAACGQAQGLNAHGELVTLDWQVQ